MINDNYNYDAKVVSQGDSASSLATARAALKGYRDGQAAAATYGGENPNVTNSRKASSTGPWAGGFDSLLGSKRISNSSF